MDCRASTAYEHNYYFRPQYDTFQGSEINNDLCSVMHFN